MERRLSNVPVELEKASRGMYMQNNDACPFCDISDDRVVEKNAHVFVIRDFFPVTPLHTLIIPWRHAREYFDLDEKEILATNDIIREQRQKLIQLDPSIQGFNIGMNCGEVAGQTIFHCHVHLIPRRLNDVPNPRGGVRNVIPGKGDY